MDYLGFVLGITVIFFWTCPEDAGRWLGKIARHFDRARALPDPPKGGA